MIRRGAVLTIQNFYLSKIMGLDSTEIITISNNTILYYQIQG